MTGSYTLKDIFSTVLTIPVFAIFLFAPGYSFGWIANLFHFRDSSVIRRVFLSLPISLVVSTVLANIVGRYLSPVIVLVIFVAFAAAVSLHGLYRWISGKKEDRATFDHATKTVALLAVLWAVVVIVSVADLQVGGKLYASTVLWDHAVRIAFLNSALRSGVPPLNPFSYLGHAPAARYYYYWYVLCSYPARLSHIHARYVLFGSSIWAGFCLAALIPIYLTDFLGVTGNIRRKAVIGILLLSITGLDIIPTIYEFLRARIIYEDMEWWDPVQVTSWQDALIWVPHHVAALIACFIGFLALWSARKPEGSRRERSIAGIFAALAFAAAAGLSVYVTFTFALFLLCWGLTLLCRRMFSEFFLYLGTACLTIILSWPYLHDLLASGASGGGQSKAGAAGGFIAFGLRALPSFLSAPYFLKSRGFLHLGLFAPFGVIAVYFLEFGVFAFIGWERLRKDWISTSKLSESEIASWYFVGIAMFVITFIRSSVISNNDLAYRSAMIVQFILLLWATEYLDGWLFRRNQNLHQE